MLTKAAFEKQKYYYNLKEIQFKRDTFLFRIFW